MDLEYKTQVMRGGQFEFSGRKFSAADVVAKLEPLLTVGRMERVDQVVRERTYNVATVAENLYDVGNISAVMRSAESYGFLPIHIVEREDAKYKKSDRISKGTEKWLDIRRHKGPEKCFKQLREDGFKIYATDLKATVKIEDIDFSQKTAVVFGNEKDGVSDYVREHADGCFILPMYGFAQSFNISVAASLCFSHIHRERVMKLGRSGDMSADEIVNLKAHYYLRTLDSAEEILSRS
jgi:tRNA (guanosine-2'-O-)-methyltransferase